MDTRIASILIELLALYIGFAALLSWLYREYLIGSLISRAYLLILRTLCLAMLSLCSIALILDFWIVSYVSLWDPLKSFLLLGSLFFIAWIVSIPQRIGTMCSSTRVLEIDGCRVRVCVGGDPNAWCSSEDVVVGDSLLSVLSYEELRAVIHHEKAHAGSAWRWLPSFAGGLWIVSLSASVILASILWGAPIDRGEALSCVAMMYLLSAIATLSALVPSWLEEHEADRRALNVVGLEPVARAITKACACQILNAAKLLSYVKMIDVDVSKVVEGCERGAGYVYVLRTLLANSINFPKCVFELVRRPRYRTHPPTPLRLLYLSSVASREARRPTHAEEQHRFDTALS